MASLAAGIQPSRPTDAVIKVNQKTKSIFKGVTIATLNGAIHQERTITST